MMPDDSERDPVLHRHLVLLPRHEPTSPAFTDRVVRDLAQRGLVRRSSMVEPRWLAAAAIIFALGLGLGSAVAAARVRPDAVQPLSPAVVDRIAVEVNVPPPGKSEVWF
jgi:hypothetical protein